MSLLQKDFQNRALFFCLFCFLKLFVKLLYFGIIDRAVQIESTRLGVLWCAWCTHWEMTAARHHGHWHPPHLAQLSLLGEDTYNLLPATFNIQCSLSATVTTPYMRSLELFHVKTRSSYVWPTSPQLPALARDDHHSLFLWAKWGSLHSWDKAQTVGWDCHVYCFWGLH